MDGWFWEKVSAKSGVPISVTQFGPFSLEELVAAVERGEIGATTRVSNGGERWKSAASFEELADALGLDGRKTPKRTPTPSSPSVKNASKIWFWQNARGLTSEPSTLDDLIAAAKRGEIVASTRVSNDGRTWRSAELVPALAYSLKFGRPRSRKKTEWFGIAIFLICLIKWLAAYWEMHTDAKRFEPLRIPERNWSVPPEKDFAPFEERVSDNPEIEKLIDEYVETYKEGGFLPGRAGKGENDVSRGRDGGGENDVSRGRDGGTAERER